MNLVKIFVSVFFMVSIASGFLFMNCAKPGAKFSGSSTPPVQDKPQSPIIDLSSNGSFAASPYADFVARGPVEMGWSEDDGEDYSGGLLLGISTPDSLPDFNEMERLYYYVQKRQWVLKPITTVKAGASYTLSLRVAGELGNTDFIQGSDRVPKLVLGGFYKNTAGALISSRTAIFEAVDLEDGEFHTLSITLPAAPNDVKSISLYVELQGPGETRLDNVEIAAVGTNTNLAANSEFESPPYSQWLHSGNADLKWTGSVLTLGVTIPPYELTQHFTQDDWDVLAAVERSWSLRENKFPAVPGKVYSASVDVSGEGNLPSTLFALSFYFYDNQGERIPNDTADGTIYPSSMEEFKTYSVSTKSIMAPPKTAYVSVEMKLTGPGRLILDNLKILEK